MKPETCEVMIASIFTFLKNILIKLLGIIKEFRKQTSSLPAAFFELASDLIEPPYKNKLVFLSMATSTANLKMIPLTKYFSPPAIPPID